MRRRSALLWAAGLLGAVAAVVAAPCPLGIVSRAPAGAGAGTVGAAPSWLAPGRPRAPVSLQARLDALSAGYGSSVGLAVTDLEQGWTAAVDGDAVFPQQSVSKLWVAISVLDAVDLGQARLDQTVVLGPEDVSVFHQPIARRIGTTGYRTTLRDLVIRALTESDNAANDRLLKAVGGPEGVARTLARKGLAGLKVGAAERDLQSSIAGLIWDPAYGRGRVFWAVRDALPDAVRDRALKAYLDDPADGASPAAITRALAAVGRGEVLSADSTAMLLGTMARARTGPMRLRGGLPPGWSIAHKTGTGQDWRGATIGVNDVGLLTAPDGRRYAVAVMIRRTARPIGQRQVLMQQVARAVAGSWEAQHAAGR